MMGKLSPLCAPVLFFTLLLGNSAAIAAPAESKAVKVEFTATPAPSHGDDLLKTATTSSAKVTFADGSTRHYPLSYVSLFKNTDRIARHKGKTHAAAQLFDVDMAPIMEPGGDPAIAETADANSLLKIGDRLFLVNHWEYDDVLADGQTANKAKDWYSRMPMGMSLSGIEQGRNGKLKVKSQRPIDFSSVNGAWVLCFGSQTPWNTHFGGEEDYDLYFVPGEKAFKTTQAGLKAMGEVYFRGKRQANPYDYGYHVEVAVRHDGGTEVTKHYQMGRGTWEMAIFANDGRTAFYGDDGTYSGLFMFVANRANMPKAGGTLYAAKWHQTSPDGSDGGTADFTWVKLGSSHYNEIKALIDKGVTINHIFDYSMTEKLGFVPTRAGSAETIWLKLKPGMETAAAFLETRRYAAYLGATTEFTKGEGVAINHADKKLYYAMSYIQGSMKAGDGGPADDIRLKDNNAGATYTFELAGRQTDSLGQPIASDFVPVRAYVEPALLGRPIKADALGNTADPEFVANADNVFYSEKMRTLFIGEDSGAHQNNFVWAYDVATKKLTRILSLAAGAEATGLQVVENLNGHAYIMSNNQHQGDWIKSTPKELKERMEQRAGELYGKNRHGTNNFRLEAHVGYIGGLPAFK
jgi:secreted PhoX family phosphatase